MSPLRSATALQMFAVRAQSGLIVVQMNTNKDGSKAHSVPRQILAPEGRREAFLLLGAGVLTRAALSTCGRAKTKFLSLHFFYGHEHQGFCLGYSTDSKLLRRARPVLYTHSPEDVLHLKHTAARDDPLSFCKSTDWQFEREWRVGLPQPGPKRVSLAREKLVSVHTGYRMKDSQLQGLLAALRKGGYKPEETKLYVMERIPMSFVLCERAIRW